MDIYRQSPLNINPSGSPISERRRKGRRNRKTAANKAVRKGPPGSVMNQNMLQNMAVLSSLGLGQPPQPGIQ